MDTLQQIDEMVTISVTKSDLGELGMLLDWIVDNRKVMDRGTISLEPEEILPSVHKWLKVVHDKI